MTSVVWEKLKLQMVATKSERITKNMTKIGLKHDMFCDQTFEA